MGCDIHYCLEVKTKNGWLGVYSDACRSTPAGERFYNFFSELAGVRARDDNKYPEARGLPKDISDLTKYSIDNGSWDHNHSWATTDEFLNAYIRAIKKSNMTKENEISKAALFGYDYWPFQDIDENLKEVEDETRVVFAFDN